MSAASSLAASSRAQSRSRSSLVTPSPASPLRTAFPLDGVFANDARHARVKAGQKVAEPVRAS